MTEIFVDRYSPEGCCREPVKEITFVFAGEDGEYLWLDIKLESGEHVQSYYMKGTNYMKGTI